MAYNYKEVIHQEVGGIYILRAKKYGINTAIVICFDARIISTLYHF